MKPHLKPHAGGYVCFCNRMLVCAPTAREAFVLWYSSLVMARDFD